MVATNTARRILAAFAAAFMTIAAQPALANSSSADINAPVRDASSPLGGGDEQFRELFASWQSLDGNGAPTTAGPSISIPSRMPVDGARMSSNYGMRDHPVIGGRRAHKGIDLASPTGTPVYATADGIVETAKYFGSYGLYIRLEHGARLETRYAHLSRLAVGEGERVSKGDLIGYVGSTGRSTGPHLHYEVRIDGEAVNPIPYMVESEAQLAFEMATGRGGVGGGD